MALKMLWLKESGNRSYVFLYPFCDKENQDLYTLKQPPPLLNRRNLCKDDWERSYRSHLSIHLLSARIFIQKTRNTAAPSKILHSFIIVISEYIFDVILTTWFDFVLVFVWLKQCVFLFPADFNSFISIFFKAKQMPNSLSSISNLGRNCPCHQNELNVFHWDVLFFKINTVFRLKLH